MCLVCWKKSKKGDAEQDEVYGKPLFPAECRETAVEHRGMGRREGGRPWMGLRGRGSSDLQEEGVEGRERVQNRFWRWNQLIDRWLWKLELSEEEGFRKTLILGAPAKWLVGEPFRKRGGQCRVHGLRG